VQVLRLHTTDLSDADNPAGHGGPGDVFTVVDDLRTPAGAEAGKAYLSCTSATPSVNLCHAAYVLKGGQIDVQVAVTGTATGETLAVTGGTGVYAGVTGWVRAVDPDRTFYLIHPGQTDTSRSGCPERRQAPGRPLARQTLRFVDPLVS
jgi:hypothetical protein